MSVSFSSRAVALCFAVGLAAMTASEARADEAAAAALTKDGLALGKKGDWAGATAKLQAAFAASPTWERARDLADAEAHTGDYAGVARDTEFAIAKLPKFAPEKVREGLAAQFGDARSKVGAVRIQANPTGVHVTVNGIDIGTSPIVSDTYVMPGRETFRFDMDGYDSQVKVIDIDPGQAAAVEVELKQHVAGASMGATGSSNVSAGSPATGSPIDTNGASRPKWPAFIGFALAAGGIGAGVGTLVAANAKSSAIRSAAAACKVGPSPACRAGDSAQNQQNTFSNASLWSFVAGGALAAASTGYLVWSFGGHKSGATAIQISPAIGMGNVGIEGRF